jgi:hypothetical protein
MMYVYIFADRGGCVKIGISRCVISRMSGIQTQTRHGPIRLVRAVLMQRYFAIRLEKGVHSLLANYRPDREKYMPDEWFQVSASLASKKLNEAIAWVKRAHRKWPGGFSIRQMYWAR